jgi:aminopeptidase YwaD
VTRRLAVALLVLATAAACSFPLELPGGSVTYPATSSAETLAGANGFSRARAMDHVRALAKRIGVRVRATRHEWRGAKYIAKRFEDLGYEVDIRRFKVDGKRSRNVVATWPSTVRYGFVVGGHMDSVPKAPGANDNASGVSVVLEMARLFAGTDQSRYVTFVAFGSEEYGRDGRHHVGSQVYVNRLGKKGRRRLAGMISVDMIADGRPLLVGNFDIGPDVVARALYRKIKRETKIRVRWRTLCDCSDNGPFEHAGIPGAFMYSGPEPDYHSPSDTVKNLNPKDIVRTGKALKAFLNELDRGLMRRFRRH